MELNKRAEMNEIPLLAIGRQSYDIVSPDNEHESGASAWSPRDLNGGGPSTMNDMWSDWRPHIGDLPHTHSFQAQHHRAKRQHCWGTASLISEQRGVGPSSSSEDESMKSLHTELFGCCETMNAVNPGFDFFEPTSNPASTSRMYGPPDSLMLVSNSRQGVAANESRYWNASAPQDTGLGTFFAEEHGKSNWESLSSESVESTKGKGVDQFSLTAAGSGVELNGWQETSYFSSFLVPQKEQEEKSGGSIDCMPKQRIDEVQGDLRSSCKRKLPSVDIAEVSAFESQVAATSESAAARTDFSDLHPIASTPPAILLGDSCSDPADYTCNETRSSRGLIERASGLFGSGEEATRSLTNQPLNISNDIQSHSQLLFARNVRRSGHPYRFPRRNLESGSSNTASCPSLPHNSDHWRTPGGEISPAPLPPVSNWGLSGSRRNNSGFSIPGSRWRSGSQGVFEGGRFRSMQGRALDWAMAAAAATVPSSATSEHRSASQLFSRGGVAGSPGTEADFPESSARISQAATSFLNSGVLASYFPAPGSDTPRVGINIPQPVSTASSHQISAGPPEEAYVSVPGQPASRSVLLSSSRGRRDALFSAPVQSLLGLPFRGLHTLRADGEYRRQFLSEILNAMHHAFRNEDLNIEELIMLDPSIIYGDAHDQHRDMRLDVDNMTYEELLALEERIGNVNTGLDEEKISLCLRESKYSSLDATVAAISQDSDVKCSICQEEFVEEDELGRLDCGHGYHSACIRQWLLQKNECPICKSSGYVKS